MHTWNKFRCFNSSTQWCLILDLLPPPHQGWRHCLPVLGGGHQVPVEQKVGELNVLRPAPPLAAVLRPAPPLAAGLLLLLATGQAGRPRPAMASLTSPSLAD